MIMALRLAAFDWGSLPTWLDLIQKVQIHRFAELPTLLGRGPLRNGLGEIVPAQSDYWQVVKNGAHGDYHRSVLRHLSAGPSIWSAMPTKRRSNTKSFDPLTMMAPSDMMEPVELPK